MNVAPWHVAGRFALVVNGEGGQMFSKVDR